MIHEIQIVLVALGTACLIAAFAISAFQARKQRSIVLPKLYPYQRRGLEYRRGERFVLSEGPGWNRFRGEKGSSL